MILEELAYKEDKLCSKIISLYNKPQTEDSDKELEEIFVEYKSIHKKYAALASHNIEALKRGLFIQWYALIEPSYLTGIANLDERAENKILQAVNDIIKTDRVDLELVWMLNYYSNWEWVFERLEFYKGFDPNIVNEQNNKLPDSIDKEKMSLRGQMGKYWNSLTAFSNK